MAKTAYSGVLTPDEIRAFNGLARSKRAAQKATMSLQDAFDSVGKMDASEIYESLKEEGVEGITLDDVLAMRVQKYYIEHPGEANILALSKVRGEQVKREAELTITFKPHEYFGSITKDSGALNIIELTEEDVSEVEEEK